MIMSQYLPFHTTIGDSGYETKPEARYWSAAIQFKHNGSMRLDSVNRGLITDKGARQQTDYTHQGRISFKHLSQEQVRECEQASCLYLAFLPFVRVHFSLHTLTRLS